MRRSKEDRNCEEKGVGGLMREKKRVGQKAACVSEAAEEEEQKEEEEEGAQQM